MSYDYQAPPESHFSTVMEENDDLRWATENDPHVVTFWCAVCAFINHEREHGEDPDRVLECPSWGQWRSIGQHFAAGKKVEATNLLRASTHAWTQVQPALTPYITNEKWKTFMAANALPAWDHHGGLSLSEAKSIIDTLEAAPYWFGLDTAREFSPRHVTCADGGHVIGGPKSLDDLLRAKISAMKDEAPKEHSLWLNIYSDERVLSHLTRESADKGADSNRIACLHITFKEGEGL